jgi:putative colanic acid biosynthesis acetyltransferase WcaF
MERLRMLLWGCCWAALCRWTPKPMYGWRLFWLRVFGCKASGRPFVHQRAIIQKPWNLILHDRACLGESAVAYTLGQVEIKARATVAQEVYLCTGTHDFTDENIPLVTARITIEEDAFIGARAFLLPGITVGQGAVIGAASVVTKNMPAWTICAGNPCKPIKRRILKGQQCIR